MRPEYSCNSSDGSNFPEEISDHSSATAGSEDFVTEDENTAATLFADMQDNERILRCFYNALASGNTVLVNSLLAKDLDLWFHGPPCHQHMSKLLTGIISFRSVTLIPSSILATHNIVIVEGESFCQEVAWVHIWTVKEGKLVQLQEYWNTAVSINSSACLTSDSCCSKRQLPLQSTSPIIWQSKLWHDVNNTKPGLILTI
ncbi:senescence associated gene 20 isoform X2 [Physcomitrium patens]|uniref:Uncharacterized protein n=2 Tax=Physcomitrium patens TaxID=3218 RepID=A0A2K1JTA9_PHYPA|nr:senescence associated gene 20-like [Physcomitrium patens]PNR44774.1 hypothetical protein PHYPA_014544 [Physcomitrium patens]|eukprot:XP_024388116.1 senescence associated gene 20-like [Physcomitrella patens]